MLLLLKSKGTTVSLSPSSLPLPSSSFFFFLFPTSEFSSLASENRKELTSVTNKIVQALLCRKFTDLPGALDELAQQFNASLSKDNVDSIATAMSLLSTRAGTLLLAGHGTPFPDLTIEQREAVLQRWRTSSLPLLRKIFRGVVCESSYPLLLSASDLLTASTAIAIALYVAYNVYDDNLLATGYPAFGDAQRYVDPERQRKHYPYQFETISTPLQVFETDMLVVGSGAGGGVVVSELAKKGWSTIVVEKGEYVKPEEMLGTPRDGFKRLYESQGLMATEDGSMNILAGSTFGGGTTGELSYFSSLHIHVAHTLRSP